MVFAALVDANFLQPPFDQPPEPEARIVFRIGVSDTAQSPPNFGFSDISDQTFTQGEAITPITLPTAQAGTSTSLTYSLPNLPLGLSFTPSTRVLSGTPTQAVTDRQMTYTVTDGNGLTDTISFRITVIASNIAASFGSQSISDITVIQNSTITQLTLPALTSGNSPFTYSISTLPVGLLFNSGTRVLSGTPLNISGTMLIAYTGEDDDGDQAQLTFNITVVADTAPDFGTGSIDDILLTVDSAVPAGTTITPPAITGGDGTITITFSGAVPSGTTLSSSGVLTGTPTEQGNFTITVTATDSDGDSDSVTAIIVVHPATTDPPILDDHNIDNITDHIDFVVGEPIGSIHMPAATGGTPPYTYNFTGLPTGISFNSSSRTISGTPTVVGMVQGATYLVIDGAGQTDFLSADFDIIDPPSNFVSGFIPTNINIVETINIPEGYNLVASWDPPGASIPSDAQVSYSISWRFSSTHLFGSIGILTATSTQRPFLRSLADVGDIAVFFVRAMWQQPDGPLNIGPWITTSHILT